MSHPPRVSVLMPVYNRQEYVAQAIESLLGQTWHDFELVIVDGGSTDGTLDILARYARLDDRVRVEPQLEPNLRSARNQLLEMARGEYYAIADSDDIYLKHRLERQVAFLDSHPKVGLCGTWVIMTDGVGRQIWRTPTSDAAIRCRLLFSSALAHSSAMLRRELFTRQGLNYRFNTCEDYDLWVRAAEHVLLANIPNALVHYRFHTDQDSQRTQRDGTFGTVTRQIRLAQLNRMGLQPTDAETDVHEAISTMQPPADRDSLIRAEAWLHQLQTTNRLERIYPEPEFSIELGTRWYALCHTAARSQLRSWQEFWRSPFSLWAVLSLSTSVARRGVYALSNLPGRWGGKSQRNASSIS